MFIYSPRSAAALVNHTTGDTEQYIGFHMKLLKDTMGPKRVRSSFGKDVTKAKYKNVEHDCVKVSIHLLLV